jgi:hypothetical protein
MRRREFRLSQQHRSSMAPGRASAGARRPGAVGQSGQLRGPLASRAAEALLTARSNLELGVGQSNSQ